MSRIVVVGGGTGISHLLEALKEDWEEIFAIVAMTDDGGGSGVLRKWWGALPLGDVRNCMAALADSNTLRELIQYRFSESALEGQSLGNLLLFVLSEITGSVEESVQALSNLLHLHGEILPVTYEAVHLVADFENGDKCIGESRIPVACERLNTKICRMGLFPRPPKMNPRCQEAIEGADVIVLGPGSLFTSIIPNLLVEGMKEALERSKAPIFLVINAMTQRGETQGFGVREHLEAVEEVLGQGAVDGLIIHDTVPPEDCLRLYEEKESSHLVHLTENERRQLLKEERILLCGDFLMDQKFLIRHDGEKISKALLQWCKDALQCKKN